MWWQDLVGFAINGGRIGLISAPTAIEPIEFYQEAGWLKQRIAEIETHAAYRANTSLTSRMEKGRYAAAPG